MEQSSYPATNRFSASEIPLILWTPKVHYRFIKARAPVPILSQINLAHTPFPLLEYSFSYYTPIYDKVFQVVSSPQVSPPKPCMHLSPKCATCPTQLILIDWII